MSDEVGKERGEDPPGALGPGAAGGTGPPGDPAGLSDLLEAARAAALLLDGDLRLTGFTPAAAGLLHLSEADRGRPVAELAARAAYAELAADARRALRSLAPVERELEDPGTGARILARLLPRRRADGSPAGLAVAFLDVTARRQAEAGLRESEERQAFLLRLSDALRPLATPADIAGTAARHLGERLGASRVCYGRIAGGILRIARDHARGVPSLVGAYSLAPFDERLLAAYRPGGIIVVGDAAQDDRLGREARAALAARGIAAFVDVVLVGDGGGTSILAVQSAAPRAWTEAERNLIRQVAERVRAAIELARAEAASRESRENLRLALRAAGMGVFGYDPASDRVEITAESAEVFGLPPGGTLPASEAVFGIVHPDDAERHRAAFLRAASEGGEWRSEYRVVRPRDGRVAWIEERGSAIIDPATGRLRVRGVHWDVTARREAEERLRESEARLSTIFASASVGLSEIAPDGRFLQVNDELCRILGRPRGEVLRLGVPEVTHPEDIGPSLAVVAEALRAGSAHLDKRYLRPDGGLVWANSRVTVMRHGGGPDTLLVVTVDLTARRQAEAALRESEARFRQFGEASADILWIRDAETLAFEYLSPAFEEIYGVPLRAVLGGNQILRWAGMVLPEDRRALFDAIRRVREGEHVLHSFRILRADGEVRWIRDTAFPLLDAEGRVQRIAGITRDVTEEVELQDRLKVLVAELQHRTRNLLAVVRSVTDRTLAGSRSLDDFRKRIRARLGALARANALLSRLDQGSRIAFDELLRAELMGHGLLDGGNQAPQVVLHGPPGVRLRSSTVQTFALALHELATNALKHGALSRPEGRLEVRWELLGGRGGERRLHVDWRESGAPRPLAAPEGLAAMPPRHGYGRELIERALPYQLKARTTYDLTPEGVRCTITLPVSSTMEAEGPPPKGPAR